MSGALSIMTALAGLAVSSSDTAPYGSIVGTGTAMTGVVTISVTGGSGSYSISWARTSGDASTNISSATSFTPSWSRTFGVVNAFTSTWVGTVTDTITGITATTPTENVELERLS